MDAGYIRIHRTLESWRWGDDPVMVYFWIRILLMANYKDKEWHDTVIQRGSFVTSIASLSGRLGLSIQQVRTCLDRLKAGGEIITNATSSYTILTICKYDDYQLSVSDQQQANNKPITNEQHTDNKQITTTKEGNKERREEEKKTSNDVKEKSALSSLPKFVKPTVEDIAKYCSERNNGIDPEAFFAFYESKGWKVGSTPMKNWKAAMTTWEKRRREDDSLFNHQQPVSTDWLVEGESYYASAFIGHEDVLNNLGFELVRHVKRNNGALVWKNGKFIIAK